MWGQKLHKSWNRRLFSSCVRIHQCIHISRSEAWLELQQQDWAISETPNREYQLKNNRHLYDVSKGFWKKKIRLHFSTLFNERSESVKVIVDAKSIFDVAWVDPSISSIGWQCSLLVNFQFYPQHTMLDHLMESELFRVEARKILHSWSAQLKR